MFKDVLVEVQKEYCQCFNVTVVTNGFTCSVKTKNQT